MEASKWAGSPEITCRSVTCNGLIQCVVIQVIDSPTTPGANAINGGHGTSPNTASVQLADAAFDYEAQHADELAFKQRDVIEVVDRSDAQWWKGRKHGTSGDPLLFPANFVQLR